MKKEYIAPKFNVVKISNDIIATSNVTDSFSDGMNAPSRFHSGWGEED